VKLARSIFFIEVKDSEYVFFYLSTVNR